MKAAVYVRISSDPEGLRAGVERQRQDCSRECERRGWAVRFFEDNDLSAYYGRRRPAYLEMLEALEAGDVGAIVAWAPDRLTRQIRELEDLVLLVERKGAQVVTIQAGEWDLTTPEGRFMARQLGLLARLEAEKIAARVQRARRAIAEEGRPHHGGKKRPWGFGVPRTDGEGRPLLNPRGAPLYDTAQHHPTEAADVREVAQLLLSGASLRSCAKIAGMSPFNLERALRSPRMVGMRSHHKASRGDPKCKQSGCPGCVLYPATWAPILDRDTWEAVRAVLDRRRDVTREPGGQRERKTLLAGFLRCGLCGGPVNGAPTSRGVRRGPRAYNVPGYKCHAIACGNIRRASEPLDTFVRGALLERAEVPSAARGADPALAAAVAGYTARLDEAREMYLEGTLSRLEYASLKADLETRRTSAEERLAASVDASVPVVWEGGERPWGPDADDLGDLPARWAWWDEADLRQRRALLADHVERIVLHPARRGLRFDPASVEIVWRGGPAGV